MAQSMDLTVQRGNDAPVAWRFKDDADELFDLTGSEFVLTIVQGFGATAYLRKDTETDDNFAVDVEAGTATWTPTTTESRLIPPGRVSRYELERRIGGTQRTLAEGYITGRGGIGDD